MKAIRTIRTYAPRTLSTSEAKGMISESLFTHKMAFKLQGKRTSKAEFERAIEGTTVKVVMIKKLNLYCMGDGNEETRSHLTFDVVIMPAEETEEPATAEEIDAIIQETSKAWKDCDSSKFVDEIRGTEEEEATTNDTFEDVIERIEKANKGNNESWFYINNLMVSKKSFIQYLKNTNIQIEYKQEKGHGINAFGDAISINIYRFYVKSKAPKAGGLPQNGKVEPTVSSTEKVVHFTNTGKDLAQTLREKIAEKEAYIREKSGSGWVTEAYIGYKKGELAGLKNALSLIE